MLFAILSTASDGLRLKSAVIKRYPFSKSPATSTGQSITNFNVLLSGVQLYNQNYNYSIEHFYQELRKINSTNGGCSIGMSSGLLSQTKNKITVPIQICIVRQKTIRNLERTIEIISIQSAGT